MSEQPATPTAGANVNVNAGRVAVVTGSGRGIGRAYALEFARQGAAVVVNDLGAGPDGEGASSSPADAVVEEIVAAGGSAVADHSDISGAEGAERLLATALEAFGRVDALVNNAGILRDRSLVSMSDGEWDAVVRIHLRGTFAPTRAFARHWRDQSKAGYAVDARVINTTSSSGLFGNRGQANYSAAKAGIASFTIVAALELERYGVLVNAVYPTAVSRLTEKLFRDRGMLDEDGNASGEALELDPSAIAPVVAWIGSPASTGISGRVFGVRGRRVVVAEGWAAGPSVSTETAWDHDELSSAMPKLCATARPNAGTNGLVPEATTTLA